MINSKGSMDGTRLMQRPVDHLPPGFAVRQLADTGVSVIDNFCTSEEAAHIIAKAEPLLLRSMIVKGTERVKDDYRTSSTASVYDPNQKDPMILPLLHRGAMLLGLPYSNVETVFVTRYQAGEYYKGHEDFFPGFHGDRLYTILIYLNDLEPDQGGNTTFERLGISVRPKLGRAVSWTNRNPDGTGHPETRHEAMPVAEGAVKWAIQLWYRRYELIGPVKSQKPPQPFDMHGRVDDSIQLPPGVSRIDGGAE